MKKTMLMTAFVVLAVLATACGGGGDGDVSIDADHARPELLYLGSASGITALAPARPRALPGDRARCRAATGRCSTPPPPTAPRTTLRTLDPATGDEIDTSHHARHLHRADGLGERRDGRTHPAPADRYRHLPPRSEGPDPAGDRPSGRPRAAAARRARQRGAGGVLAVGRRAVRDRLRPAARARALPRRTPRPHAAAPSTTCAARKRSCRSRSAAPHAPRPSPPTVAACTRSTHGTRPPTSPPRRSCTCSTSTPRPRAASTSRPSSPPIRSARSR